MALRGCDSARHSPGDGKPVSLVWSDDAEDLFEVFPRLGGSEPAVPVTRSRLMQTGGKVGEALFLFVVVHGVQ